MRLLNNNVIPKKSVFGNLLERSVYDLFQRLFRSERYGIIRRIIPPKPNHLINTFILMWYKTTINYSTLLCAGSHYCF